ncbi:MAG: SDR family oxidoreductase [Clostridiales Family XIII bacterium]|jgi:NAD(P)-dependent dehydrogenase (short-subunit alcohol dehydrogenase family)|nr:SDR family oxidoreductase [Clostridiales Family XIII bacterium]
MGRLEGKTAVVTGAGNGIGRATAIRFAKEGARVVLTTRNPSHGEATLKTIETAGGTALFVQADVRDKAALERVVDTAVERFGRIDVLANCAGVLVWKPFLEQDDDDFSLICETNFRSQIRTMQRAIPHMVAAGGGSIINVASISAMKPEINSYFYGAFKAAAANLTMNVAKEFAPKKVRVNCVCPGPVQTGLTPDEVKNDPEQIKWMEENIAILGRLGEPDDIANMNLFLASDESSWITGQNFVVDGGTCISAQ